MEATVIAGTDHLPDDRSGANLHFEVFSEAGRIDGYVIVNFMPDGRSVREAFVKLAKPPGASAGDALNFVALSALLDSTAMCMSKALAAGVPLVWFVKMFRHTRFEPSGRTNWSRDTALPCREGEAPYFASSPLDFLGFLLSRYVPEEG